MSDQSRVFRTSLLIQPTACHYRHSPTVNSRFRWSLCGRFISSSSLDWNLSGIVHKLCATETYCLVWDLSSTSGYLYTHTFESLLFSAQLHPTEDPITHCLVTQCLDEPALVNIRTGDIRRLPVLELEEEQQVRD